MTARRSAPPGANLIPLVSFAPPVAAMYGWWYYHEPMHVPGLGVALFFAMILGVMAPGLLVSVESLPLLLIPDKARIRWRQRSDHRPAWRMWLKRAVHAAERNRCGYCGRRYGFEIDHIKPWSRGGLSALWNLMLLCQSCNQIKSNYWVARDGYVFFRPRPGAEKYHQELASRIPELARLSVEQIAAEILAYELRHRWSPGRWIRAGWSLGR